MPVILMAPKRSKYFSRVATCYQGHKHDSIKEARRCDELNLIEKNQSWILFLMDQKESQLYYH